MHIRSLKNISYVISFCMLLYSSNTVAQQQSAKYAINFSSQDYKQVIAFARASHKKIFVDAYATWCAPCKELQKTTFKDAKAAAYFNKYFVNISIDVEKGEGINLAKTWQIEGLPTLLILDEKGKIITSHVGYINGNGLLEFAKEAAGKKLR